MPEQTTRAKAVAKFLADADFITHLAIAAELRRMAEVAISSGDRAAQRGQYRLAISNGQTGGQRKRAATAVEGGKPVDPRDLRHVEQAIAHVRDRQAADRGPLSTWDHRPVTATIGKELL